MVTVIESTEFRTLDVVSFVLYELIPAVLEHEWVEGASLLRNAAAPMGSRYGTTARDPSDPWATYEPVCVDPLVDAGAALAGEANGLGYVGLMRPATHEQLAEQLEDFGADALAVIGMCEERAPAVAAAVLLGWSS